MNDKMLTMRACLLLSLTNFTLKDKVTLKEREFRVNLVDRASISLRIDNEEHHRINDRTLQK